MAKDKRFLVVAPKLALIAELGPTKKAGFYALRSLRQINGDFITDQKLITANLTKLFGKLDSDQEYSLVLPDNLFLDRIENVSATSDAEIKKHLSEEILPDLKINLSDYQIKTASLLQLGQTSRIQISAAEDKLLEEIARALSEVENPPIVTDIIPLSWLTKSIVTLEPSLSIVQIGDELLLAQHYIGIVQTRTFELDEVGEVVNFIKKIKEKEADLQTIYLLTDEKIEKTLSKGLRDLLPLQQLSGAETGDGVAPMIKTYLEAAARSLDIPEYAIPFYSLAKITLPPSSAAAKEVSKETEAIKIEAMTEEEPEIDQAEILIETEDAPEEESTKSVDEDEKDNGMLETKDSEEDISLAEAVEKEKELNNVSQLGSIDALSEEEGAEDDQTSVPVVATTVAAATMVAAAAPKTPTATTTEADDKMPTSTSSNSSLTLPKNDAPTNVSHQSALVKEEKNMSDFNYEPSLAQRESPVEQQQPAMAVTPPPRKSSDGGKKIFVFIGVFLATVAVGLALGFGAIALLNKDTQKAENITPEPTPVTEVEVPVATESAEVLEEIDRAKEKILVVNATKTAGLAGKLQTTLKSAGYTQVETGNSADAELYTTETYYVLVPEENKSLVTDLEKATNKTLTTGTSYDDEDGGKDYDAIIVINTSD